LEAVKTAFAPSGFDAGIERRGSGQICGDHLITVDRLLIASGQ